MNKLRMKRNTPGYPDGITARMFTAGLVYDEAELGKVLYVSFLSMGVAEEVTAVSQPIVEPPNKAVETKAPETKKRGRPTKEEAKEPEATIAAYLLAQKLDVNTTEVLKAAKGLGIEAKNNFAVITLGDAEKIESELKKQA